MRLRLKFLFIFLIAINFSFGQILSQPANVTLCNGVSGNIIIISNSTDGYRWQDSTTSGWQNISNGSIYNGANNDTLTINNANSNINGRKVRCIVDSAGALIRFDTSSISVITVLPVLTQPIITSNQTICYNSAPDTLRLTQNANGGNGIFNYQWEVSVNGTSWSIIVGQTGITYKPSALISNRYYRIRATSNSGCGTLSSDSIKITVRDSLNQGSIGGNQTICYNSVTSILSFSAAPTGAGGNFLYQWQSSIDSLAYSDILSATNTTYNPGILNQTKYYRSKVSSSVGCGVQFTNTIKIKVFEQFQKALIGSNSLICYGNQPDTLKIISPATGGNLTYNYQWISSNDSTNWSIITGATNSFLRYPVLFATRYFKLISSSGSGCGSDTSNQVSTIVYPALTKPTIGSSQIICFATSPDTITRLTSSLGGNGQFSYQWQSSFDGFNWIDVTGQTDSKFKAGILKSTIYYRTKATSLYGCGIIYSDSVKIIVNDSLQTGIIASSQNICYNTAPQTMKFSKTSSGGGNIYTYQWQVSTDSILFINSIGQTKDSLVLSNLTATRYYRIQTISNAGCGVVSSNIIKINVYTDLVRSDINVNNITTNICFNSKPDTIKFNLLPTGGNSVFTHQWQSSSNGIDFININGANDIRYLSNELISSTYFRVLSTSSAGCGIIISDTLLVFVYPNTQKPIISGNQSICYNTLADTIRMIQHASGANGQFSYQWQSSINGLSWINAVGFVGDSLLTGSLTSSRYYRIQAKSTFGCSSRFSDSVFVNVYAPLVAANISSNQNICYNSIPSHLNTVLAPSGGGSSYSYQWQHSEDSIAFNNLIGQNNDSIILGNLISTKYYKLVTTSTFGCGSESSNIVKINVYEVFNVGRILGNDTICYNFNPDSIIISAPATGGDKSYTYQWLLGADTLNWSQITGANSDFLFITNLRSSSYYKVIMTTGSGCGFDSTNWIYVKVNPLPDSALINGPTEVCRNQRDLAYKREARNPNYNYNWGSLLGNIQYGVNLDSCFLFWGLVSGIDSLKLIQTNPITGCTNTMILPVQIKDSESPNRTSIIRKPNSNILICEDQQNGITYQWGYIQKLTSIATDIIGATLQYVQLPFAFDTTQLIYYVRTSLDDCSTISYYKYDPIPVGIHESINRVISPTLYPNPTTGKILISTVEEIKGIFLTDQNGKNIEFNYNANNSIIEIGNSVSPGIYFIRLAIKDKIFNHKVVLIK